MKMKFNIIITLIFCLNFLTFIITEESERNRVGNSLPGRNEKEFPESSSLKDGKKGSIYSLTEHPIICSNPDSGLSGFQLWGKFGFFSNSIAYQWKCNTMRIMPGAQPTQGEYDKDLINVNKKDPIQSLKDINFKCPKDSIIKGLSLLREGDKLRTKTTCIKARINDCYKLNLPFKNIKFGFVGKSSVSQLGQFKINLKPWQALQEVKGDYEKGDFRYRIKWCNIGDKPARRYLNEEYANSVKKPKVLYSNPKTLKLGDDYCKQYCKPDTDNKQKCLEYGVIGCSHCNTILPNTDPKHKHSQAICYTYCNIYKPSKVCKFYEFRIIVKKKKISTDSLKAFNLQNVVHKNIKNKN